MLQHSKHSGVMVPAEGSIIIIIIIIFELVRRLGSLNLKYQC